MIVPDANLLLYSYDTSSPFHPGAKRWWERLLSGSETVALCPVVLFAFVRIGTSAKAFMEPLSVAEAATHVRTWLRSPAVRIESITAEDCARALALLEASGAGGDLTTDAQIAALAGRLGAMVHTADTDFSRFEGIAWENPLD